MVMWACEISIWEAWPIIDSSIPLLLWRTYASFCTFASMSLWKASKDFTTVMAVKSVPG
jgi:hypothetical protein